MDDLDIILKKFFVPHPNEATVPTIAAMVAIVPTDATREEKHKKGD